MRGPFSISCLLASALLVSPASAQAPNCTSEQYRRFAPLEGEWESVWIARNQVVGRYRFDATSGGCALAQSWTGAPATPGRGTGLIAYSPADRTWHRFWTDDTGTWEMMTAPAGDGPAVTWNGQRTDPNDPTRLLPIRLTQEMTPEGTIREVYQISRNGGESWTPFGQFLLRRVGGTGS